MVRTSGARGKRYISLEIYSQQQISVTFQICIQRKLSNILVMEWEYVVRFDISFNRFLF